MMTVRRKNDFGRTETDWLRSFHHFSFAEYYDPERMGFGALRVVNDDEIKAGTGFGLHPHRDMEIVTYVCSGAVLHRDSLGNAGTIGAGEVQVMSAGSGILHSEHAAPGEDVHLFQIWILPREKRVAPRWEQRAFPETVAGREGLPLLVSGRAVDAGRGALMIHQDAAIFGGRLAAGQSVTQALRSDAYVIVTEGLVRVQGHVLSAGDAAELTGESALTLEASEAGGVLVLEV